MPLLVFSGALAWTYCLNIATRETVELRVFIKYTQTWQGKQGKGVHGPTVVKTDKLARKRASTFFMGPEPFCSIETNSLLEGFIETIKEQDGLGTGPISLAWAKPNSY